MNIYYGLHSRKKTRKRDIYINHLTFRIGTENKCRNVTDMGKMNTPRSHGA